MAEELVTIEGQARDPQGKTQARKLRKNNLIPAVILEKGQSTAIQLDPKWLHKAYKAEGKIFNLTFKGATRKVTIKDLQLDHVKRLPLHVDLMYV